MKKLTIDDIKKTIHNIDLIKRPYIIFIHPDDAEAIKAELPGIEEKIVIQTSYLMEKGKIICIKRENLELGEPHIIDFK